MLDSLDSSVKRILKIGSAQGFKSAVGDGLKDGTSIKTPENKFPPTIIFTKPCDFRQFSGGKMRINFKKLL